jgi:hypothetical protein
MYDIYVPATLILIFVTEAKNGWRSIGVDVGHRQRSIPLLEAGVQLTCVDLSAESNAFLKVLANWG